MKFVKFLENHFQELKMKEGKDQVDAFNLKLDSEIKATHTILNAFRKGMHDLMVPKVIIHYALVLAGIAKCPEPVLLNKIKQQKEDEELAKANQEKEQQIKDLKKAEGEFH